MADATLHIKLEGDKDLRHNPLLDEMFGDGPKGPPPLPRQAAEPELIPGARGSRWGVGPPPVPYKGATPPPLPEAAPGLGEQLAGMLGGRAMAAAGPAAVALLAVQQLTSSLQGMKRGVDSVTAGLEGLANNELPTAGERAGMISDMVSSIPIVGEMVAAQLKLQAAVIELPEKVSQAFLQRAGQLAQYSGPISSAEAIRDVRAIQADIREAQALGPNMARMVDAQSRLDITIRELLLPIKKFIVEVLADRLELMADGLRVIIKMPELLKTVVTTGVEAIILAISFEWTKAGNKIEELPNRLAQILKAENDDPADLFEQFFRDADNAKNSPGPVSDVTDAVGWMNRALGLPAF